MCVGVKFLKLRLHTAYDSQLFDEHFAVIVDSRVGYTSCKLASSYIYIYIYIYIKMSLIGLVDDMQYKHPKTCISVLVGIVIFVIQTVLRTLLLPLSCLAP